MQEDIEALEIAIDNSRYSFENFGEYESLDKSTMEAIETVLNRIKELEMEIQVLENTRNSCPCIKTSGVSCNTKNDYISKDKIREKIKYYKEKRETDIDSHLYYDCYIAELKELLEE